MRRSRAAAVMSLPVVVVIFVPVVVAVVLMVVMVIWARLGGVVIEAHENAVKGVTVRQSLGRSGAPELNGSAGSSHAVVRPDVLVDVTSYGAECGLRQACD